MFRDAFFAGIRRALERSGHPEHAISLLLIMPRIETKDGLGRPNGWLIPIWHVDNGPRIEQVYLTTILPGCQKGPHLHMKRSGLFTCIRGHVTVVRRTRGGHYHQCELSQGDSIGVDPGIATALYNSGREEVWLLNMPSPAWRADDQDEHPVEDWTFEPPLALR